MLSKIHSSEQHEMFSVFQEELGSNLNLSGE
jgi:hypothetical protein